MIFHGSLQKSYGTPLLHVGLLDYEMLLPEPGLEVASNQSQGLSAKRRTGEANAGTERQRCLAGHAGCGTPSTAAYVKFMQSCTCLLSRMHGCYTETIDATQKPDTGLHVSNLCLAN